MTRNYAAAKLLEHGPLTLAEFMAITHWGLPVSHAVMRNLVRTRVVYFTQEMGSRRRVYQLREAARA